MLLEFGSPAVAFSFDTKNNEGIVGTMCGSIRYINWSEGSNV